ncbi:MAG: hypothetical protein E7656_05375 [Ruminococcaceae bacterium]|nr:hypothetical protein [Oscillospiraceae bacterium]
MKKAIILAGGRGTRLAPITDGIPKPLVPFLGKSLLERIIEKLARCGIDKIMITTGYRSDMIRNKIGHNLFGASIEYLEEKTPLGTAGGLVFSREILGLSENEEFLVISGDCVCDFDLLKAHEAHRSHGADATVITSECDDPLEYGVVLSKSGGLITAFNEKPCWSQVGSCRVNTGVYILSSKVIDLVPKNVPFDFSKDLFPLMLDMGMKLYEHNDRGYWCDVGNIESYYKCCIDALKGKIYDFPIEQKSFSDTSGIKITPPCYIPHDVTIEKGAEIGPNVILSSRCSVGKNCEIVGSILHSGVRVCENSRVEGAVICENAVIGKRSSICGGSVIAKGITLSECSYIPSNSKVTKSTEKEENADFFSKKDGYFDFEQGLLLGQTDQFETKEHECVLLGKALSDTVGKGTRTGIMHDGTEGAQAFSSALAAGLERGESEIYDFGEGFENLAKFQSVFFGADCFVFTFKDDGSERVFARLLNRNGLAPSHDFERRFSAAMQNARSDESERMPKRRTVMADSKNYYYCEILDNLKAYAPENTFSERKLGFCDESLVETELLKKAFCSLGGICVSKKEAVESSVPIVCYDHENGVSINQGNYSLDRYHVTAAIFAAEKKLGTKDYALPYLSPGIYSSVIGHGARVVYYPNHSVKRFALPQQLMQSNRYLQDDIMLAARFISLLAKTGKNISEFYFEQPLFGYREKTVYLPDGVTKTLVIKNLSKNADSVIGCDKCEGIRLSYPDGKVTVVPGKAQLFKIYSESRNAEMAKELCDVAQKDILKAAEKNEN